jgi:sugar phosphate isomerase/epimerase
MKIPKRNYMDVGVIHFMSYPSVIKGTGPIEETLKKILKDDYFNVVEVTWIKDKEVRKRAHSMIKISQIRVVYGSQPRMLTTGMNINDLNKTKRKEAVNSLKEGIDEACDLGAEGFAFLSGTYKEDTKNESYKALLDSTFEICEYAKNKNNMPIVLEIFDYNIDKKSIIGPAPYAAKFAAEVRQKYDNFGLMIDLSHIPLTGEDIREALLTIKDYLVHVHIGNAVCEDVSMEAYGDNHPRFGFPGGENGVEELVEFLRTLIDIGYLAENKSSIVSFEVKPWGDEDPDIILANAKRTLNEAWVRV